MVRVETQITPFKLSRNSRKPVELMVEVTNDDKKSHKISYEIVLANTLAFDKQGLVNAKSKRFECMKPGEKSREYYDIWAKTTAREGEHPIIVSITEHYNDFKYVLSKKNKNLSLTIID
jgi:hypothetical protein